MKTRLFISFLFALSILLPPYVHGKEPVRRGLFVTVIHEPPVLSSREAILQLVDDAKKARVQILFIQIYRANKAWFPSKVGDTAPYKESLEKVGEDPFALLIKTAHAEGIEVHAWLNLLSLSYNKDAPFLKKYGPGILTRNLKEKKTLEDYKIDNQFFLEAGDPRIREELSRMVGEVVSAYPDLNGLQFDYIRYPDENPAYGYTELNIERFKEATGIRTIEEFSEVWRQWKRDQVTGLVQMLVTKAREIRPGIRISTTACTSYIRAYHEAFQEWPLWLDSGLVDFVTIMGYSKDPDRFKRFIKDAKKRISKDKQMNIAIGAYELGPAPKTFERELQICEKARAGACVIFHYGSLLDHPVLIEPWLKKE